MAETKKYEYIDSLRGIAILYVIIVHIYTENLGIMNYIPQKIAYFMQLGRSSVPLFFMVSAYTLVMSYHNRKEESHATRNFFIRRVFRIFPMFYVAIILYTFVKFLGFNFQTMDLANIPIKGLVTSLFMIHGLFPAWTNGYVPGSWTVSFEFIFYLGLPFLCRYIQSTNKAFIFLAISMVLAYLSHEFIMNNNLNMYDYAYFNFFNHVPAFALGILAYWVSKNGLGTGDNKAFNLAMVAIIMIIFLFTAIPIYMISVPVFFVLILCLKEKPYKLFSNKVLAQVGKQSFSIYLIHFAIISAIEHFTESQPLISVSGTYSAMLCIILHYLLVLGISMIITYFTYYYIEEKGIALGRKLIKKLNG